MSADRKAVPPATMARMIALRAEGLTIAVIASRVGFAESTVRRTLSDARRGVTP